MSQHTTSKTVHLLPSNSRNTLRFTKFLADWDLDSDNQFFLVLGNGPIETDARIKNSQKTDNLLIALPKVILTKNNSRKVIIHGLFNPFIVILLSLTPKAFLPSLYWVVWGGDLYAKPPTKTFSKKSILYRLKKRAIKKIKNVITYIPGDLDLILKNFNATPKMHNCLMYPGNLYKLPTGNSKKHDQQNTTKVIIGNSGSPENNHHAVFEALSCNSSFSGHVYCPLAYGDSDYIEDVIKLGYDLFGNRFHPLQNYLDLNEYVDLVSKMDAAIYNYDRQQGMGNIITMLGLDIPTFINSNTTPWELFQSLGLTIFDTQSVGEVDFNQISAPLNSHIVKNEFSEKNLAKQWKAILET